MPLAGADSIVQVATGSTGGTDVSTMFVTLPSPAQAGNTVFISTATSFVSITDYCLAETLTHPLPSELYPFSNSPTFKPNTPSISNWGVYLDAPGSSWEFDWIRSSDRAVQVTGVAWVAVEVAGLIPFDMGGGILIPWEVNGAGSWWYDGGVVTAANTADGTFSGSVFEGIYLASFAAWVPSSRPPAAVSFAESTTVGWGGWTALAPNVRTTNVSTPNVGLDVAYKVVYGPGQFDCLATYGQAPGGIAVLKDIWASDVLGVQRTRSSLSAMISSG